MAKKVYSWIILVFLCPILLLGTQKSKKAYELIYQDVQILKMKILELKKQQKAAASTETIKKESGRYHLYKKTFR